MPNAVVLVHFYGLWPDCYQRLKIAKLSQRSTQDSFGRKIQLALGNSAEALKNE
jgi:hypothetical protein